jgi:hypothetical protein
MAALGLPTAEAHDRAVLAYTSAHGLVQAERAVGGRLFLSLSARGLYLQFRREVVLPRPPLGEFEGRAHPDGLVR